jgi:6-phosphogluconolactonase
MWIECPSSAEQLAALTRAVTEPLQAAIAEQGHAVLAVSGGRSPIPLFHALREAVLDWSRVSITLVDERFVPRTHPDSNEKLVREHLLLGPVSAAEFRGLVSDANDLAGSVAAANRAYQPITVALLGMGEDGHTASLFPDAPELAAGLDPANPNAYLSVTPLAAPHARISLTLAALLSARQLLLSISGDAKRHVYQAASAAPSAALPISYLIHQTQVPFDAYWTN